jgi:hypothetical protein
MSSGAQVSVLRVAFEKGDTVFFAVKPDGVMLHNYAVGEFVDLDKNEELLWKYCDGTMNLSEAIDRAIQDWPGPPTETRKKHLHDLAERLLVGGFLRQRE